MKYEILKKIGFGVLFSLVMGLLYVFAVMAFGFHGEKELLNAFFSGIYCGSAVSCIILLVVILTKIVD